MNSIISNIHDLLSIHTNPKGYLISIWGDFGVGKSSLCIELAKNCLNNNEIVYYFYTKPVIPYEKLHKILKLDRYNPKYDKNQFKLIKIDNFTDLLEISYNLEFLVIDNIKTSKSNPKIIVIDSLTDFYKLSLNQEKKEENVNLNARLNQILANFFYIAQKYNIFFVIVNEISQKFTNEKSKSIQSGGKVIDFWIEKSIKIERTSKLSHRKLIFHNTHHSNITKKYKLENTGFSEV